MAGNLDQGDICISEWPDWVFEAKDRQRLDLAGAVDEAKIEAENAGVKYGAAILKRAKKGVQHSYVVMDLDTFTRMMTDG